MMKFRDGFCYLGLFHPAFQTDAKVLGHKPDIAAIRRYVNANHTCLAEGKYTFSLHHDSEGAIGHVQVLDPDACAGGLTSAEVIGACAKGLRLGSAGTVSVVRDSTSNEAAAGQPVQMEIRSQGPVHKMSLPVGGYLNQIDNYMVLDPRRIAGLRRTYSLFESVRLESFSMTVTVQGDMSTVARLAATSSSSPPMNNGAWATAEASMTMTGNNSGATVNDFTLPRDHQFGRELKGLAVTNLPPVFHFYVTSSSPCHVWFRGYFSLLMSGQGNPSGVDLSSSARKMEALHPAAVIGVGVGQGLLDDDSDSEDEGAVSTSPTTSRGPQGAAVSPKGG